VLTPLVPELTYDDLVIVDGMVASVEIARLLFVAQKIAPEERDRVRKTCSTTASGTRGRCEAAGKVERVGIHTLKGVLGITVLKDSVGRAQL